MKTATMNSANAANFSFNGLRPTSRFGRLTYPINRAHWIKFLILLNRFDGVRSNFLAEYGAHPPIFPVYSSSSPTEIKDVAKWMYLQNADFFRISMTQDGSVMFHLRGAHYFIIDQKNLDQGLVSLGTFGTNGEITHETCMRPYNLVHLLPSLELAHPVSELAERRHHGPEAWNTPVDMNAPILDILDTAMKEGLTAYDRTRFAGDVEYYAPEYLAMEAEGRTAEYDPDVLLRVHRP
ncbi:hypothetical protein PHISCL_09080 [Aspergillus sclerotialis]|uniref:Uncharacterized protein n=1 Tax=Aspergillus sclerotialis TaxID=2070753 RepID=A0A3A2ZBC6_9EURO|nr:hypothetical protein PHISCL_09080 [Aspergillus sclerotialis]